MQYEVKESGYGVTITSAKFDVVITPEAPLNVAIGESARMEIPQAINYIKSGEAEIKAATDIGISRISSTVTEGLNQFNANATAKTNAYNDNATDKTTAFNNNATSKTGDFNDNFTDKLAAFDLNAGNKTTAFNNNASDKTTAFNDNAATKQAAVDASAAEAKQWAIGEPSEPTGNSAKYWANQAASSLSGLETRVTTIEGDIPAQASSSNQLADKNFVNSSIATNTANFIGTFNSVADLEAYSGTLTNNDYAFAISTDAAGNTLYNRYKWNGTAWLFEYALNNSSFTANQWAAINSGATIANIGQIATNTTAIATKADDNAVVHKTGNETITGTKTFTGDGWITRIKNTDVTYNTAPSSNKATGIVFADKNGTQMGVVECYRWTDNSTITQLNTYGPNGNWSSGALQLRVFSDGYSVAYAPTPYVGANGREIATAAYVKNILSALYPVGSIYIGTQSTCPLATLISGSTWELVSAGRVLQGSDSGHNAGTTIEAGLPNHTHHIGVHNANGQSSGGGYIPANSFNAGSVIVNSGVNGESGNGNWTDRDPTQYNYDRPQMTNASDDNSIYGNSNTVQPPAYVVNIWRRTA